MDRAQLDSQQSALTKILKEWFKEYILKELPGGQKAQTSGAFIGATGN